jgi:hypothetical protein
LKYELVFSELHPSHADSRIGAHSLQVHVQPQISSLQVSARPLQGSDGARRTPDNSLPSQGDTLKTDVMIHGTKIYSDATWKTKKTPGRAGTTSTGIGVYCQIGESNFNISALIQASTPTTPSVLQAEAEAFLLAARIASILRLKQPTFLTDCSTLAKAAVAPSVSHPQIPWEIRRYIVNYFNLTQSLGAAVYHIKRDINGVAHNCAHQAIRQNVSEPIFSCSNSAHKNISCPLLSAVKQMQSHDIVIHAVNCI